MIIFFPRLLIKRRRNNQLRSARTNNHQTTTTSQNFFSAIWMTNPFDPPAYENAYNSSLPVAHSSPPPYDETKLKNEISNQTNNETEFTTIEAEDGTQNNINNNGEFDSPHKFVSNTNINSS